MHTFIALLRGVNVGKARRVPMAELRELLTGLGFTGVATLRNSGNVVFRSARRAPVQHAAAIAETISTHMGVEVPVIVKSVRELDAIVSENPLAGEAGDPSRLLVTFARGQKALRELAEIKPLVVPPERFAIGRNAAYLDCVNGILESKAAKLRLGKTDELTTTRNWATVLKLQALAHQPPRRG